MLHPFIDFKPAQLSVSKKDTYVYYYVINPFTNLMERKRIRLNYIKSRSERLKYGRTLCFQINEKLYEGWNPFLEEKKACAKSLSAGIADFLEAKSKSVRPDTMRCYSSFCKHLSNWLYRFGMSDKFIALFTKDVARRYMNDIANDEKMSNTTYNNYLSFMVSLFSYFLECDYIGENPFAGMKSKREEAKLRTIIPKEDRDKIKRYFIEQNNPGFNVVMMLCFRLLIRPKEILMLRISDIDFGNKLLTVDAHVAKNHHARTLAIPDDIMSFFDDLRCLDPKLFIFSDNYIPGKNMKTTRDIGRTWSIMRSDLNLPKSYQFYSLKDTGITELLESGMPPKFVKELADHHSLEMTERYTHKSDARKILEFNNIEF